MVNYKKGEISNFQVCVLKYFYLDVNFDFKCMIGLKKVINNGLDYLKGIIR